MGYFGRWFQISAHNTEISGADAQMRRPPTWQGWMQIFNPGRDLTLPKLANTVRSYLLLVFVLKYGGILVFHISLVNKITLSTLLQKQLHNPAAWVLEHRPIETARGSSHHFASAT